MDRGMHENYYETHFQARRMESTLYRPVSSYLSGFDGQHLVYCLICMVVMYGAGYIIARLFFSGIMFFLAVGLTVFFIMQIVDSLDTSGKSGKYAKKA